MILQKKNIIDIADVHITETTPPSRKERHIENVILNKLKFAIEQAKKYESQAIVCNGDLFHKYRPSIELINKTADVLQTSPCPFVTVIGNHDVAGGNCILLS